MVNLKDLKNLTDKQKNAVEPLIKSAFSYNRKINYFKRRLNDNPTMDFSKKNELKNRIASFEKKFKDTSKEIDEIINAKVIYKQLIDIEKRCRKCIAYMDNKWGFEDETN